MNQPSNRRPLNTRGHVWARNLARFFVKIGMTPNQMSLAGLIIAALGTLVLASAPNDTQGIYLLIMAGCIQLRLLANMLDGLMAIEEGKQSKTGPLYNEIPDRFEDILFFVAAGYAAGAPLLGMAIAIAAVLTAYIRVTGASLTGHHDYSGPMAKPHRMFVLTISFVLAAILPQYNILLIGLIFILIGTIVTAMRRIANLYQRLNGAAHD